MDLMDIFQIGALLEELASHKNPVSKEDIERHLEKVAQIEPREPQAVSGCWVDRDGILLAIYFSWSNLGGTGTHCAKVMHINTLTSY